MAWYQWHLSPLSFRFLKHRLDVGKPAETSAHILCLKSFWLLEVRQCWVLNKAHLKSRMRLNLSCYCNIGFTTLTSLQGMWKCEPPMGITCALPASSPKQSVPACSKQSGARGGKDVP